MLKYQIDVQISPQKVLVIKIYEGDTAVFVKNSLYSRLLTYNLDKEQIATIERIIDQHCAMKPLRRR